MHNHFLLQLADEEVVLILLTYLARVREPVDVDFVVNRLAAEGGRVLLQICHWMASWA